MATALYRRYRPESFAEVIGQDHVTTPLRRALRAGRVGHAYLFSGPRGCGKTTSARILARCLNCAEGPTDTPCGVCDSCVDLARGGSGSLDVVEIDAASHGGVDDARELRERASFAPVRDRYKVFIIDEAHMVTSAGFNALLKLVEEPPEHVKFVFATTEPDKVIGTIRSRTHHYPFRLIPPQILGPYLEEVCAAEGVQVGDGVLPLVVRAGGGSARDSMSVLDQLMAGAGEDGLDFPTAIALLGFTDTALLDRAITAVAQRDAASLYGAVEHVLATGHEPRRFVEDLLERMRDLIVLAAVPERGADLLPQVPADELESMRAQAALFDPADLSQCGDLVHETLSTMSGATSPRLHLELLAARLVLRSERAALAAADADSAGPPPRVAAPAGSGGPGEPGGGRAPHSGAPAGGSGASAAREEARRIAQEKVQAARQARGDQGGTATDPQTRHAPAPADRAPASQPVEEPPSTARAPQPPASRQSTSSAPWPEPSAPSEQQHDAATAPGRGAQPSTEPQRAQETSAPHGAPAQAPAPQAPQGRASEHREAVEQSPPQPGAAASAPAGGLDAGQVRGHWSAILDELQQIRRPSWALISQNGHVHATQGSTLVIGFRTEGLINAFHRGTAAQNLADAVRRIMHTEVTIEAVVGEDPGPGGNPAGGPGGGAGGGGAGEPPTGSGGGPAGGGAAGPGGGRGGAGPSSGEAGPAVGSASADPAPAPARWGDAVTAPAPHDPARQAAPHAGSAPGPTAASVEAGVSAGQRASERAMQAAARAAQNQRSAPADDRVEDFAPEPDDPYPPDPQDDYQPAPRQAAQSPQGSAAPYNDAPVTREEHGDGRDWAPSAAAAMPPSPAERAPSPNSGASAATSAPVGPAPSGEPLVVEDAGRDSLPPGQPRTFGQNALRRAIAEGRVVHSRPAPNTPAAPSATSDAGAASAAPADGDDIAASRPATAWGDAVAPGSGQAPTASPRSEPSASDPAAHGPATAVEPSPRGPAPEPSAAARAAASWGTAHPAGAAPGPGAAPAGAASAPAPRSGAALVREAAQASRSAGQRSANRRGGSPSEPPADTDPTGGATRDDADAVVSTRNGREVVEKLLGGRVLEIIDETQAR